MINKTQFAMFAIAAFALSGMGMAPAFASTTSTYNYLPSGQNGVPDVDTEYNVCSTGHNIITTVTPYTTWGGFIKVVTDATSCSQFEDVVITVHLEGTWCSSYTTTSDFKTTNFFGCDFVEGDTVQVWAVYTK